MTLSLFLTLSLSLFLKPFFSFVASRGRTARPLLPVLCVWSFGRQCLRLPATLRCLRRVFFLRYKEEESFGDFRVDSATSDGNFNGHFEPVDHPYSEGLTRASLCGTAQSSDVRCYRLCDSIDHSFTVCLCGLSGELCTAVCRRKWVRRLWSRLTTLMSGRSLYSYLSSPPIGFCQDFWSCRDSRPAQSVFDDAH